jgi:site-specific recombinase XerD
MRKYKIAAIFQLWRANNVQIFAAWLNPMPMPTFKVLLDKRRCLKNGTFPLVIRVYSGKNRREINLKTYLKESQFDTSTQKVKKTHPNEKIINQRIKQTVLEVEKTTLSLEMANNLPTSEKIKSLVVKPKPKYNFMEYGEHIIQQMRAVKRNGNANAYRDALNALKTYCGRGDLQFQEVNYELLCTFENKMLAAGLKKNSIAAYNRSLRAIFNKAINEDLVELKFYPYRKYKVKGEATAKRNIAKEDISCMLKMELKPDTPEWHATKYFILSFNLRGISFADMACIKAVDISNGRLIYKRQKTHKLYIIKLTPKAQELLYYYKQEGRVYILPIIPDKAANNAVEERKYIQYATKTCNRHLKKIGALLNLQQQLTTYFARHSWATIAKKMGYSKYLISEALGHSFGNRITEVYLDNFDQEVIDEMNEQVCKF